MGKFRSKLKGQSKGKRWPKGQSASSNPVTRKYRDEAKSRFFQVETGPSKLTSESLMKHDALQLYKTGDKDVEMPDMESESSYSGASGSYQSMQSFASDWSECSNMSFNKFLRTFQANSALHKEMLAILAAITDVIKMNGGTESSTEYYCSLLTTLDTLYNAEEKKEEQVTAVLALLNMGIKTVPEAVLKKTFSDVTMKMLHVLQDYSSAENNAIIKALLGILATVLRAQELALWNFESTKQVFAALLNPFCIHSKPKWRKAAQHAVAAIVKSPCFEASPNHNPAADKCADFCQEILANCTGGDVNAIKSRQTTILHTLGLLKETIQTFSTSNIKKCCETILRLMTLNYPIVTSSGLQVLHSLFAAQNSVVSSDLNGKLIAALYEYQPSNTDIQPTLAWLLVMQEAHVHLADVDLPVSVSLLPAFFNNVVQMWLCGKTEVISGATHCLEVLLKDAIRPACESEQAAQQHRSKLEQCFNTISGCLSYQYNAAWSQVLHVIGVMFEVGGANCSDLLEETLCSLAELRDSYKFSFNSEVEYAMGAAIRSMGPEKVLDVVPLRRENGELNMERSWLLPVLKENINGANLSFFRDGILPLANFCQQRAAQLAQVNNGIGAHSSELLYMQLWNLLPCFCNQPGDIQSEFKSVAKLLGMAVSDRKELRLAVMAGLRKLILSAKKSENSDDLAELGRFDKNYLPILFNIYTIKPIGSDEEGQRLAALETIKLYLTISRPELNQQLFSNALERLNASSDEPEDHFIKESILDLIKTLIPYQSAESIAIIYEQCVKNLPAIKNNKEQKKAYRILEEIVSSESEGCKQFVKANRKDVQRLLGKSLNTAATSSKGARLRCFNYLIKAQPQLDQDSKLIRSVVPEAILCCKDINEKCRQIAFELINTVGETLMGHDQMQQFVLLMTAGLAGSPQMISCNILALASVLHNFTGALGQENIRLILDNVATLSSCPAREIVTSCLSFVKVYCTALPSLMVQASLDTVMKALTGMTEDCQRHFRLKVRDLLDRLIRKYGADSLKPFVAPTDETMLKRIRNLRKLNDRKNRKRKQAKDASHEEEEAASMEDFLVKSKPKSIEEILADSDSELDGEERAHSAQKSKKQAGAWIEEDAETIIDFTDAAVARKVRATKPRKTASAQAAPAQDKNRGFKTAADGRLLIKDDGLDSDDDQKKPQINQNSDSSDSEDEATSVAQALQVAGRKRKRAMSVKSGFSYQTGGVGIHRPINSAASVKSGISTGGEYKSKKSAGDVKRKGQFDPYAYLPLQRSALNRRKRAKGMGQLASVVKGAKSGALKGAKAKKHRKNTL
ncbi:hypothetical protein HUJ04_001288 [Dendroctonus ponderosae]|uniref:Uncharacterized protein n=1 Tax=Dendroctonus ponderosae TaxID=77166 RepID=N6URZ0_DENPD|nr:hypothetical protein YQE_00089 [Dendroctonus ponderosae]KAH1012043.1 hypothetical protein HUJ04_001288 [Dendroctonus ponderosae]